jgi:hypothetical protein
LPGRAGWLSRAERSGEDGTGAIDVGAALEAALDEVAAAWSRLAGWARR